MAESPGAGSNKQDRTAQARAERLLDWYDVFKRPLPWRRDTDPYRVWLSEAMLQQTRVETAIPYYQRFLRKFPSVRSLARAPVEEVHALWSGLGYYRRAAMLHQAARRIVESGAFPKTSTEWRRLPGVGPYTAAAVASICFGERVVALDGNLERVLARLEAYGGDPKKVAGRGSLVAAGESWLDGARPGDSNQALMELGATICLPSNPRCGECPISDVCVARRLGRVDDFPRRAKLGPKERHELIAICVRRGARLLLFRRGLDSALLAGTWEAPWVRSAEANPQAVLAQRYGGVWKIGKKLGVLRHTITNRMLALEVHEGTCEDSAVVEEGLEARWTDPNELEDLPHSSLVRKVFEASTRDRSSTISPATLGSRHEARGRAG